MKTKRLGVSALWTWFSQVCRSWDCDPGLRDNHKSKT